MKAQEIIQNIDSLLERIANSDSYTIQRDLNDDPFEPLAIDILGNMYSYESAEVIGQHPYWEGANDEEFLDIRLNVKRFDDLGVCEDSKIIQFVCSIEWLECWMNELKSYLEENTDEEDKGFGSLANQYFEKAAKYEHRSKERGIYWEIAMALHYSKDKISDAIANLEKHIEDSEKSKLSGESSDYLHETWDARIQRYQDAIRTLKEEQEEK